MSVAKDSRRQQNREIQDAINNLKNEKRPRTASRDLYYSYTHTTQYTGSKWTIESLAVSGYWIFSSAKVIHRSGDKSAMARQPSLGCAGARDCPVTGTRSRR